MNEVFDCTIFILTLPVMACGVLLKVITKVITMSLHCLSGWDKNSYGYHGDDGNSFCCSGTGQPYGPTFTTGDIIGCCVNLIDGSCFYTKNGVNLGKNHDNL